MVHVGWNLEIIILNKVKFVEIFLKVVFEKKKNVFFSLYIWDEREE